MLDSYSSEYDVLSNDAEESPVPNYLLFHLSVARHLVEFLDELSNQNYYETTVEFAGALQTQELLLDATTVLISYFTAHVEAGIRYMNTFQTDVRETVDLISIIADSDNPDMSQLVDVYRKSGTYFEYAAPPVLGLVDYLEAPQEEIDFEKYTEMQLSNILSRLRTVQQFREFAEPYNSNIRNAVSHGGSSGYELNPMAETITFRYHVGDTTHSETMTYREFQRHTIQAATSAIALYLFPFFFILLTVYQEVAESVGIIDE